LGHDLLYPFALSRLQIGTHVSVANDPDQFCAENDGQPAEAPLPHLLSGLVNVLIRLHRYWVIGHTIADKHWSYLDGLLVPLRGRSHRAGI
jgi:hypothetical protein